MITKHFFKTLIMFTGMVIVGLLGVFLLSYFDEQENLSEEEINNQIQVAQ